MPAPTRARLAALGLQGLDPKKKYTKVGKDGLFSQAEKKEAAQIAPVTEAVSIAALENPLPEEKLKVEEKVERSLVEASFEEPKEQQPVLVPQVIEQEQEEKKEVKSFKKFQKKIVTPV
jgi:hypothetical protein